MANTQAVRKRIFLTVQEKGNAGKTLLSYFIAQKELDNPRSLFIELDDNRSASHKRYKFLADAKKFKKLSLRKSESSDAHDSEKLLTLLQRLAQDDNYDTFFVDCGSTESSFLYLLFEKRKFNVEEIVSFLDDAKIELTINLVISNHGLEDCIEYFDKVVNHIKGKIPIDVYINKFSFSDSSSERFNVLEEHLENAKKLIRKKQEFNTYLSDGDQSKRVHTLLMEGIPIKDYLTDENKQKYNASLFSVNIAKKEVQNLNY